jgi:restriction system protein
MPGNSYYVDVRHEGLNTYRRFSGRDSYVVQQRAAAQLAAWNDKWANIESKKSVLRSKEQKKEDAAKRTKEAEEAVESIENTLVDSLEHSTVINWTALRDVSKFEKQRPVGPTKRAYPAEPQVSLAKYQPVLGFLDRIFSSKKQAKISAARIVFENDVANWRDTRRTIDIENANVKLEYERQIALWDMEDQAHGKQKAAKNTALDAQLAAYLAKQDEAIADYCDTVLSNSDYPDAFPKSWRLDYNAETRMLVVEYSLPNIDALPRLKEVKYSISKDEFTEEFLKDSILEKIYDDLLYQITLRSLHEIFAADSIDAIEAIVFNGWVKAIDKATGQETNGCILSVQVKKPEFSEINLSRANPKACFKKLKGVGSSSLVALVPIRPILQLDTEDERFVPSHEAMAGIDESVNLAAMQWEEFEYLIRQLFESEYSTAGSEVKITRASHDGGVDAVIFDPDPLHGGKSIIQAKRYTNTVGVSAVRDLYGTVMNEGANKGILVTTADFGPDAYEFAKDKPLVLISGNNLLHLLEKHGHKAKIDLKEAKQILQDAGREK